MVWAAISMEHRTPLVVVDGNLTAQRYVDEILRPHLLPLLEEHAELRTFQQDNARPHVARVTREFLDEQEIQTMPWPPYSPDLNPIEHLWDELGRRVMARGPITRAGLIRMLHEEWGAIPQETIRTLIRSMRRRCVACVDAQGGHIPY